MSNYVITSKNNRSWVVGKGVKCSIRYVPKIIIISIFWCTYIIKIKLSPHLSRYCFPVDVKLILIVSGSQLLPKRNNKHDCLIMFDFCHFLDIIRLHLMWKIFGEFFAFPLSCKEWLFILKFDYAGSFCYTYTKTYMP